MRDVYNAAHMLVRRPSRVLSRLQPTSIALVMLLVAAFALRVYRLDWDNGHYLHPDERHIASVIDGKITLEWPPDLDNLLNPAVSHLNPRSDDPETGLPQNFAYGALPLFVTEAVAEAASAVTGDDWTTYYGNIYKVGRALSALFDTATVLIVFLIARRLFSRQVGLIAATVAALTPMSIQLAHFFTTDSWLTFFVALTLLLAIVATENGGVRWFAAAGAACGLAMATKGSVFTLGGVIAVAVVLDGYRRWRDGASLHTATLRSPINLIVSGLAALGAFALFEPYALARLSVYLDQLREQSEIVRGIRDVPYTRQYIGTTPVIYQVEQIVRWGFGPVAGILALSGVAVLAWRCWRAQSLGQAILLSWFFGYGIVISVVETKFLRYEAPLIPVLAITAAVAFEAIWRWLRARRRPRLAGGVGAALLIGMALWTASYTSIFAVDHPRIAASKWIYANIPPGSTVSAESWDDPLPMGLSPGLTAGDFQLTTRWFDMYGDRPPAEMATYLYGHLEQLDYVILSSNRVSSAMPRSPWRYAVQERFYNLLASGQFGFELVADFHRYPGIGPWRVPDQSADESFINYDHPQVLIYQKQSLVSRDTYDELMSWAVSQLHSPTRHAPEKSLMLDDPVGELSVVDDARWSSALTENSFAALVVWILLLIVLQAAGWPITAFLLSRFSDAGWGFSRLLTLMLSGYVVWLGANLGLFAFRAVWAAAAVAIVATSWLARRQGHGASLSLAQRRTVGASEVVFWAIFGLFLLFRHLNPDSWHPFWGGEKPMEFAHINAILRSPHFPPYDPWFSDGYINYYYYGLYLVAFCIKLTGIPAEIAFNVAQPTMMALLGSAIFSLASTLGRDVTRRARMAIPAGVLGVIMTLLIGNLDSFVRVARAFPEPFNPSFEWTWNATRLIDPPSGTITEFPYFTGLWADLHAHVVAFPITVLAIALSYEIARQPRLLAVALHPRGSGSARTLLGARAAALALCLGTLSATNAWDVPVYLALAGVAVFMAGSLIPSLVARIALTGAGALAIGVVGYGLFLPFFQYYVALYSSLGQVRTKTNFWQFASHLGGLLTIVAAGLIFAALQSAPARRRAFPHPALALGSVALLLVLRWGFFADGGEPGRALTGAIVILATVLLAVTAWISTEEARRWTFSLVAKACGVLAALGALVALGTERPVLAIALAFAGPAVTLWLAADRRSLAFVGALIAAASLVVAGAEVVYVVDDLAGGPSYRMNTIFKFYNQVWILLAVGAASLAALMIDRVWSTGRLRMSRAGPMPMAPVGFIARLSPITLRSAPAPNAAVHRAGLLDQWAAAGTALTAMIIVISLFYSVFATLPRLEQRFTDELGSGTLNALDWMNYGTIANARGETIAFAGDRAAIDWLNEHVAGSPVIAEASIGPYRGNGSRVSIATGLPTILGWKRHEYQQRYPEGIEQRERDVRELYDSPDPAAKERILRRYRVEYIVVGDVERHSLVNESIPYASVAGIAALQAMVGTTLAIAFEAEDTTIYRVLPPQT